MKKIVITLISVLIGSIAVFAQRPEKISGLQSYVDKGDEKIYYNLIKVNDTLFLMLKDNKPIPEPKLSPTEALSYVKEWWGRMSANARDGKDYFIIDKQKLGVGKEKFASIPASEKIAIDGQVFESGSSDYNVFWDTPYSVKLNVDMPDNASAKIAMGAVLYCCTDQPHKSSPHCGENTEKLKADNTCTKFKVKAH